MKNHAIVVAGLALCLAATASAQSEPYVSPGLLEYAKQRQYIETELKREAHLWAKLRNMPVRIEDKDGTIIELMAIREGGPVYFTTDNTNAADSISTDEVHTGGSLGLNLDGSGVRLGIWDGGMPRLTHQEYGGRVTAGDGSGTSGHATHVAGTMIGSGVSATAKGMSPAALLQGYSWSNDDNEMIAEAALGMNVSNHSYGQVSGWYNGNLGQGSGWYWLGAHSIDTNESAYFGIYQGAARAWDIIANDAPFYLIFQSAGNDRGDGPNNQPVTHFYWHNGAWQSDANFSREKDGGVDGFDSIQGSKTAKNIMTIGAVSDVVGGYAGPGSVNMSSFSGWGPMDDSRIKPDVVANGVSLRSSTSGSDTSYGNASGTSMSSPNASGSAATLVQHYNNTHSGADPRAATLKAVIIHGADEAGANTGPDYTFGWGLMNTKTSAEIITQDVSQPDTIQQDILSSGGTDTHTFISDGSGPLRFTMVWNDPAGASQPTALDPTAPALVNDLDMTVTGPGGPYQPYKLSAATPAAAATTGDNDVDNVEMIHIAAPAAGTYTVTINHEGAMTGSTQRYSLVTTGHAAVTLSTVAVSTGSVPGGKNLTGTVTLTGPAPTGGRTVSLSDDSGNVSVPPTVTVPAGSTSANFTVNTDATDTPESPQLTAQIDGVIKTAGFSLTALPLAGVTIVPTSLEAGQSTTATVSLSESLDENVTLNMSDNSTHVTVSSTVTISSGSTSANATVDSTATNTTNQNVTVTAAFGSVSANDSFTLTPRTPEIVGVDFFEWPAYEGQATEPARVTIDSPAPAGGVTVTLSASYRMLQPPTTVTIPEGQTSLEFNVGIDTSSMTLPRMARLRATYNGTTVSDILTVFRVYLRRVGISPNPIPFGGTANGRVYLNVPAPPGGVTVDITSSSPRVTLSDSQVFIPEGQASAPFQAFTTPLWREYFVAIRATYDGRTLTERLFVGPW